MRCTNLLLSAGAAACLAMAGCERGAGGPSGSGGPSEASSGRDQAPEFAQIYTVRGQVHALPDPGDPRAEFQIRHEEIPEFVGGSGEVVGMRAMTMSFPTLARGVSLEGLKVGDKIRFTFGVEWVEGASRRYPTWTVTAIEVLPGDTELQFTAASQAPVESVEAAPAGDPPG